MLWGATNFLTQISKNKQNKLQGQRESEMTEFAFTQSVEGCVCVCVFLKEWM